MWTYVVLTDLSPS